jgi:hypothetical protein
MLKAERVFLRDISAVPAEIAQCELARLQLDFDYVTTEREQTAAEEQRLGDELRQIKTSEYAIETEENRHRQSHRSRASASGEYGS